MYEIAKKIPIPKGGRGSKKYPFEEMEIGDSFEASGGNVQGSAVSFALRNPEYKFKTRKTENGIRVWRIPTGESNE